MKRDWDAEAKKMAACLGEHLFQVPDGIVGGPQPDGTDVSSSGGLGPFSFPNQACERFREELERFREELAASGLAAGYDVDPEGGTVAMIFTANMQDRHVFPVLAIFAGVRRT